MEWSSKALWTSKKKSNGRRRHADDPRVACPRVQPSVDLEGWSVPNLDRWCGSFLDNGDVLYLGASIWGGALSAEAVGEEEVDQAGGQAGQVHPVPGVDQLVDYLAPGNLGIRLLRSKPPVAAAILPSAYGQARMEEQVPHSTTLMRASL